MTTTTLATTDREQAIANIFCTALEGGIGYWSQCSEYHWSDGAPGYNQINEFRAVVQDVEDEDGEEYVIDAAVIKKGARLALDYYKDSEGQPYIKRALIDFTFGNWDDLDYDATVADVIVQFGLFGELVYG